MKKELEQRVTEAMTGQAEKNPSTCPGTPLSWDSVDPEDILRDLNGAYQQIEGERYRRSIDEMMSRDLYRLYRGLAVVRPSTIKIDTV